MEKKNNLFFKKKERRKLEYECQTEAKISHHLYHWIRPFFST